nr:integrase core domain-containing protein [Ferrimicrobium sp.]
MSSANGELFISVIEAQLLTNQYRHDYNRTRAHSPLGYLSPHEFLALDVTTKENGSHLSQANTEDTTCENYFRSEAA